MLKPVSKDQSSPLIIAQAALRQEGDALYALADTLDHRFTKIVDLIHASGGRVIVSGIGKSGHVARKIAATLSSTGTPAMFVHPAEAAHGDLGMITPKDIVLTLSKSGEAVELIPTIDYCKRFEIPLIAMTAVETSTLARNAQYALVIPPIEEACPMGLAPTTSTTLMMALGDALAIALLNLRQFSPGDFKVYHPGGALGKTLMTVGEAMRTGEALPLIDASCLMEQTLIEMSQKSMGCVGVMDQNCLVGIITDGDLRRHMAPDLLQRFAKDVMTQNPLCIAPETLLAEALSLMSKRNITSLFVRTSEHAAPCGILHLHDCLRARMG